MIARTLILRWQNHFDRWSFDFWWRPKCEYAETTQRAARLNDADWGRSDCAQEESSSDLRALVAVLVLEGKLYASPSDSEVVTGPVKGLVRKATGRRQRRQRNQRPRPGDRQCESCNHFVFARFDGCGKCGAYCPPGRVMESPAADEEEFMADAARCRPSI